MTAKTCGAQAQRFLTVDDLLAEYEDTCATLQEAWEGLNTYETKYIKLGNAYREAKSMSTVQFEPQKDKGKVSHDSIQKKMNRLNEMEKAYFQK